MNELTRKLYDAAGVPSEVVEETYGERDDWHESELQERARTDAAVTKHKEWLLYREFRKQFPSVTAESWKVTFKENADEFALRYFLEEGQQTATEWCREQGALPS